MIQKQIVDIIEKFDTIIIHHHVEPDPDCIGSQLGLKYILQAAYPQKNVFAVGQNSDRTRFLGDHDVISDDHYENALGIIVDVGDKHRVVDQRVFSSKALIKIDHHPLTTSFADLEWVDTAYAAVTEMIIDLVEQNSDRLALNEQVSRVLYAGLLTDTGRYYYDSVTERTLLHGSKVYAFPFDKQQLYADLYYKSINELKFNGFIQSHFTLTENGLGYMKIDQEMLERFNIDADYASGCVNILSNITEVNLWIFFVEYRDKGHIRVEFRSRGPVVNELARQFGGGGHRWASGAIARTWDEVKAIVEASDHTCRDFFRK